MFLDTIAENDIFDALSEKEGPTFFSLPINELIKILQTKPRFNNDLTDLQIKTVQEIIKFLSEAKKGGFIVDQINKTNEYTIDISAVDAFDIAYRAYEEVTVRNDIGILIYLNELLEYFERLLLPDEKGTTRAKLSIELDTAIRFFTIVAEINQNNLK